MPKPTKASAAQEYFEETEQAELELQNMDDLTEIIKECFLIFEGVSRQNKPYRVVVVKKKYAFNPLLISVLKAKGVTVLQHNSSE